MIPFEEVVYSLSELHKLYFLYMQPTLKSLHKIPQPVVRVGGEWSRNIYILVKVSEDGQEPADLPWDRTVELNLNCVHALNQSQRRQLDQPKYKDFRGIS